MKQRITKSSYSFGGFPSRFLLICLAVLFFRMVLDFVYVNYVTRVYNEFPLIKNGVVRVLESYILALLVSQLVAHSLYRKWRASGIILIIQMVIVIIPLTALYALADAPPVLVYAAIGSILLVTIITDTPLKLRVPRPNYGIACLLTLSAVGISAYVYGWLLFTGGLNRINFNLLKVYEIRSEYVESLGPLMGYFVPWQGNIINPLALLYALRHKKYRLLGLAVIAQLLLFSMTGFKSFLFYPVFAFGVYLAYRKRNAILWIVLGLSLLVLFSYAYFSVGGGEIVPSLFIRRLLFVQARTHVLYYDFFSRPDHPKYMLSESILKGITRNPYDMPMVHVIALNYWGRYFWPDVGYLGDAYAQLGLLGMFLFSIMLGFVLRMIDNLYKHLPINFVAAVLAMPAMALAESALFTSLLTHGLIYAALMIWAIEKFEDRAIKQSHPRLRNTAMSGQLFEATAKMNQ